MSILFRHGTSSSSSALELFLFQSQSRTVLAQNPVRRFNSTAVVSAAIRNSINKHVLSNSSTLSRSIHSSSLMSAAASASASAESTAATAGGPMQQNIHKKLTTTFSPIHLEIINESYMHSVPRGSESHFKVIVVSASFDGQSIVARHRAVHACLAEELKNGIHALSITARTPVQWEADQSVSKSPACLGGSKHDQK